MRLVRFDVVPLVAASVSFDAELSVSSASETPNSGIFIAIRAAALDSDKCRGVKPTIVGNKSDLVSIRDGFSASFSKT